MKTTIVQEGYLGALYEDGVFVRVLKPGRHEFEEVKKPSFLANLFKGFSGKEEVETQRRVQLIDTRNRSLTLKGQEILTADKVAVRISILIHYRVVDVEAALHKVESYEDRIYEDVQLSARRFLSEKTLDEILKDRNEISDFVRKDVEESAAFYGVEVSSADVKDLVFPGNLREIMNRVLETERQSEAMLIEAEKKGEAIMIETRAENEANALKLEGQRALADQLATSPELLRLRELETLERISSKSGVQFYVGMEEIVTKRKG